MSAFIRLIAIALSIISAAAAGNGPGATVVWNRATDDWLLSHATRLASHTGPGRTVAWLQRQPTVQWAGVGQDGKTVVMVLRDGVHEAILPASSLQLTAVRTRPHCWGSCPSAASARAHVRHYMRPLDTSSSAPLQPRAVVLEPFAGELGLGPHAGDAETEYLHFSGYAVDSARDTAVTVGTFESLSQYNFVYLDTHSGVNQYGEGVVATGELEDGNPAIAPLLKDGTVYVVGVDGTSQRYYGVLSSFVTKHMGQFAPGSILFINGCSLLRATLFWQALAVKGVGSMISFSDDVAPAGAQIASAAVFSDLVRGRTVADAVGDSRQYASGISNASGGAAHLGFVGDGSLRIEPWASAPTHTPPSLPTATPASTSTPVPTRTPIPTPTLAPAPPQLDRGLERRASPPITTTSCNYRLGGRNVHCSAFHLSGPGSTWGPSA